jgi:hypothetical protein
MSNREPTSLLLRFGDIRAWLPCITQWQMRQLVEAKLVKPVQVRRPRGKRRRGNRGSGLLYLKSEIKSALGLDRE